MLFFESFDTITTMSKIRLFFLIVISVVSLICLFLFITLHRSPAEMQVEEVSQFKVTEICGNGKVYYSHKPIEKEALKSSSNHLKSLDIKKFKQENAIYIHSDKHTSFEFYCFNSRFVVLPDSYLYYYPKTKEILFYYGEFYWYKEVKSTKLDISLVESQNILTTSSSGRIKIVGNSLALWNFSDKLKFVYADEAFNLNKNQLFSVLLPSPDSSNRSRPPVITTVFPQPSEISPKEKVIALTDEKKSEVPFEWRVVRGKPIYKLLLYPSPLKETILLERKTDVNNVLLDLLEFEERDFYWEVFPIDPVSQLDGVPSQMGHVKLIGALMEKKNVRRPPELHIDQITNTGTLVIVKGRAEPSATLYINDKRVIIEQNGNFMHTVQFDSVGKKKIEFVLTSPLGVRTIEERYTQIFSE